MNDQPGFVVANGSRVAAALPRTLESLLLDWGQHPRSVVVELNGDAVSPSQFASLSIHPGDRLEIVRVVAGG